MCGNLESDKEQAFGMTTEIRDTQSEDAASAKHFRIVVVDDEESIQNLMQSAPRKQNHPDLK